MGCRLKQEPPQKKQTIIRNVELNFVSLVNYMILNIILEETWKPHRHQ